ncbi:adenosine 5-phosphosulfate kinase [Salmonella enterica subsp. enterica]|uniref:Adenosine 5-phosphosulfate kinase n=1 Tax=Salmonella enterica I TaxID=59201 RepID=A0A379WMT5_SALET|nr:adenosine 5-phosphosulfate kinase [Salmonella enterica subsp. enterica]
MALHDENVVWHSHPVTVAARDSSTAIVAWCCGLPDSPVRENQPVAGALEEALHQRGVSTYLLDGDNVRTVCAVI